MKKLLLITVCAIASLGIARAQTETLTLVAVKKGEEPKAVMDAVNKDFPKAIVNDISVLPAKLYGEHWSVNTVNDPNGANVDYYEVSINESNEVSRAVYDKSGKLLSSMAIIKDTQLPPKIVSAINKKYAGWKVVNDREKINYKNNKLKEVYKVEIVGRLTAGMLE
jgi:hypothetical protein